MKIIVINPILFTHEKGVIPHVTTIKETMIYDLCLAYHRAGHAVTLIAAADYAPEREETYDFEVVFLKSIGRNISTECTSLFTGSMEVLTAKKR